MKVQTPKAKNEQHLHWIRNRTCCVPMCGDWTSTEAAHVRMAASGYAKKITGMQIKPRGPNGEECYVVPLCGRHHRRQHEVGEAKFWSNYRMDPIAKAQAYWIHSGDDEAGEEISKNPWND